MLHMWTCTGKRIRVRFEASYEEYCDPMFNTAEADEHNALTTDAQNESNEKYSFGYDNFYFRLNLHLSGTSQLCNYVGITEDMGLEFWCMAMVLASNYEMNNLCWEFSAVCELMQAEIGEAYKNIEPDCNNMKSYPFIAQMLYLLQLRSQRERYQWKSLWMQIDKKPFLKQASQIASLYQYAMAHRNRNIK